MSVGALDLMPPVQVFNTTTEAITDTHHIYATTARPRDMVKQVLTAKEAATDMKQREAQGQKTAILIRRGTRRTGQ